MVHITQWMISSLLVLTGWFGAQIRLLWESTNLWRKKENCLAKEPRRQRQLRVYDQHETPTAATRQHPLNTKLGLSRLYKAIYLTTSPSTSPRRDQHQPCQDGRQHPSPQQQWRLETERAVENGRPKGEYDGKGLRCRCVFRPWYFFYFIFTLGIMLTCYYCQIFACRLLFCTKLYIYNYKKKNPFKSRGLGQAKPEPSRERQLWLGLRFDKAGAGSSQAKAAAFRPSRAVQSTSNQSRIRNSRIENADE